MQGLPALWAAAVGPARAGLGSRRAAEARCRNEVGGRCRPGPGRAGGRGGGRLGRHAVGGFCGNGPCAGRGRRRAGPERACGGVCTARGFGGLGERGAKRRGGGRAQGGRRGGGRLRALGRLPSGSDGLLRPAACWEL